MHDVIANLLNALGALEVELAIGVVAWAISPASAERAIAWLLTPRKRA